MAANDKLLIITQKVDKNAPILGFFHEWIRAFAQQFEEVNVICLEKGEHNLPGNVSIHSLGKEKGGSRLQYLKNFYTYIFGLRKSYDAVFVHMNQIYVLLGGLLWRLWGKKILWWKAHGHLSWDAKLAASIPHKIITSSEGGFSLSLKKRVVVGQGIDTDLFRPGCKEGGEKMSILSVGRLSPVKHVEDLIEAASKLEGKVDFEITIAGPSSDLDYVTSLKGRVREKNLEDKVRFIGSAPPERMPSLYRDADMLVNNSDTDSLDKVVFEAMASGAIPITCNRAFQEILKDKGLFVPKRDITALKEAIMKVVNMSQVERNQLASELRQIVIDNHSLRHFAEKIYEQATA